MVKTSLEDSQQHGQRHMNILVELLGTWSNLISEIECLAITRETLVQIIALMHARVMEVSIEVYMRFKEDKHVLLWHQRVARETSGQQSESGSQLSIVSLDAVLSQMSAVRSIVYQYFIYLEVVCGAFAMDSWGSVYAKVWKELDVDYTALEFGYMTKALNEALQEVGLLEVIEIECRPQT